MVVAYHEKISVMNGHITVDGKEFEVTTEAKSTPGNSKF